MSAAGSSAEVVEPRLRVLIADDDRDIRMLMRMILSDDERLTIVGEAEDGADAVEQARKLQPGGVVLDLNMPHLDGWQAAEAILTEAPGTAVVMFTSAQPGLDSPPHPTIVKASPNWTQRLVSTLVHSAAQIAVDWPAWERRSRDRAGG
ncbi:MAG TPA: response regulator [Acidimicrobiales bacterium]|nr:response regulator [Acidimicrobiales bacterium]